MGERQLRDPFQHAGGGTADNDQRSRQTVLGHEADQFQTIGPFHLQITDRYVDRTAALQGKPGNLDTVGRQHIEHLIGVEHLMQSHQLKGMIFENQNLE